mmetsp:Transcript_57936/g.136305  ORF Transcript_57936/g.136305 Transcript_57936/m.136305 type:complete len:472 (+) Transcript_57936:536-1951(+)
MLSGLGPQRRGATHGVWELLGGGALDAAPDPFGVQRHRALVLRRALLAVAGGAAVAVAEAASSEAWRAELGDGAAVLPDEGERGDQEDDGAQADEEDGGADVLVGADLVAGQLRAPDGVDCEQQPEEKRRRLGSEHGGLEGADVVVGVGHGAHHVDHRCGGHQHADRNLLRRRRPKKDDEARHDELANYLDELVLVVLDGVVGEEEPDAVDGVALLLARARPQDDRDRDHPLVQQLRPLDHQEVDHVLAPCVWRERVGPGEAGQPRQPRLALLACPLLREQHAARALRGCALRAVCARLQRLRRPPQLPLPSCLLRLPQHAPPEAAEVGEGLVLEVADARDPHDVVLFRHDLQHDQREPLPRDDAVLVDGKLIQEVLHVVLCPLDPDAAQVLSEVRSRERNAAIPPARLVVHVADAVEAQALVVVALPSANVERQLPVHRPCHMLLVLPQHLVQQRLPPLPRRQLRDPLPH